MTVADTFADAHIHDTSSQADEAANKSAASTMTKYFNLTVTHVFAPMAMKQLICGSMLNSLVFEMSVRCR